MSKIPKIIHYCWFGGNPLSKLAEDCIESWKKHCPDYEFVRWDESNFDLNCNRYVLEAYNSKKWAFVTDYVRLYALYHYGGIYMDTDVEVVQSLDQFLYHDAFTGCENEKFCVTGLMAARKNHPWIKSLLSYYDDRSFILPDGDYDHTPNTEVITDYTIKEYGWKPLDKFQELKDGLVIYPFEYFCSKDYETGEIYKTENTYSIHHFNGSWHTEEEKKWRKKNEQYTKLFGKNIGKFIVRIESSLSRNGIKGSIKKLLQRLRTK